MTTTSNKSLGTAFEEEFADLLHEHGFWVHLFRQTETGQPADMIAVKDEKAYLIDAKLCSNNTFPLSRVEENQELAMQAWSRANNDTAWFALKLSDDIYMEPYSFLYRQKAQGLKGMSADRIRKWGIRLGEWLAERGINP